MSYLQKAVANRHWGKLVAVLGVSAGLALLLILGLNTLFEFGPIGWLLAMFVMVGLNDFVMAWDNERAIKGGRIKLWNEIVGESVLVAETFAPGPENYKGFVKFGMECWAAESSVALSKGAKAKIVARKGLLLHVEPSV